MGCTNCANKKNNTTVTIVDNRKTETETLIAGKSDTPNRVRVVYYGGGSKVKTGSGCSTCRGGKGGYTITTSETIRFVSEDAPNGMFKETFSIGHDYYVTEKQAEYLLGLTYVNKAGQIVHKFKRPEEGE